MNCRHICVIDGHHYAYTAPVNTGGVTPENTAARGGITYTQTCYDCQLVRSVNENGNNFEFSAWLPVLAVEALEAAEQALGRADKRVARDQLQLYAQWRLSGGMEPANGDERALALSARAYGFVRGQ